MAIQEGRHGDRRERRTLWASAALNGYLHWPGLGQVCCVERRRRRKGRETVERVYAITSLPPERADAARLLAIWRGHWGIENRLHWVRDVVFGEDKSQVRTESAPQLMAALRNLVIGMLRLSGVKNIAAALRHYSWKPWETLTLLGLPRNNKKTLSADFCRTSRHTFWAGVKGLPGTGSPIGKTRKNPRSQGRGLVIHPTRLSERRPVTPPSRT